MLSAEWKLWPTVLSEWTMFQRFVQRMKNREFLEYLQEDMVSVMHFFCKELESRLRSYCPLFLLDSFLWLKLMVGSVHLMSTLPFLYPPKTSDTLWFSFIERKYWPNTGLIYLSAYQLRVSVNNYFSWRRKCKNSKLVSVLSLAKHREKLFTEALQVIVWAPLK